jgi:hypothetical protein
MPLFVNFRSSRIFLLAVLLCLAIFLVACAKQPLPEPVAPQTQTSAPTLTFQPDGTATPQVTLPASPTPNGKQTLFVAPYVPEDLLQALLISSDFAVVDEPKAADYSLAITTAPGATRWIYALVAPFPTLTSQVSSSVLQAAWHGTGDRLSTASPLLMEQATLDLFSAWWGSPATEAVKVLPASELMNYAWQNEPTFALVPFEAIEPKWKVLAVDDQSPLHKDFSVDGYALAVPLGILDKNGAALASLPNGLSLPASNREASKLTVVALTGVTALVRGTAAWMERYGITYPAQDVGSLLRQADIAHVSNEIPFSPDCPSPTIPTPVPDGQPMPLISFCSSPDYIALLEEVGADVVEITGDHFADWGDQAMQYTLELYQAHNLPVYGGGMNADQARQPVLLENNGNKLAFIGCNIGWPVRQDQIPQSALATANHPGAAQCDFEWLSKEIPRLRAEGYQVIFTFQHREYDRMKAEPVLVQDFGKIASYGATIVSGSQAHQPHGMAFDNGAFIHYGLGNLFFDQYHFCAYYACDYAFIDQHYFYDNRYLGVEPVPIIFVDLARPRLMTVAESTAFLTEIFTASGWTVSP